MQNLIAGALTGISIGALLFVAADKADAGEPYGGCDESINYVSTAGADWCRDHGWTITRHIVVDPDRYVRAWHHLPKCANDEPVGGPCRWNFGPGRFGNGEGRKFWVSSNDKVHYVVGVR